MEEAKKVATPGGKRSESVRKPKTPKLNRLKKIRKKSRKRQKPTSLQEDSGCNAVHLRIKQANNLRARLVALGLNARVNSSAEWNRVIVGPLVRSFSSC